ncbi:MAG: hypothetical protein R3C28_19440 [Pirellulaceae bacterium]
MDQPELAVVQNAPKAWVSNGFQLFEYDPTTWLPVRSVVLSTRGADALATDGGRIYAKRTAIEMIAPGSFLRLDSISRFDRNGLDITDGKIINGSYAIEAYGAHEGLPIALNLNIEGVAIAPELGRIYYQQNDQIFAYQYPLRGDNPEPVAVFDLEFRPTILEFSNGELFVNDQSMIFALDPQTGNVLRKFELGRNPIQGFAVVDQAVAPDQYVVSGTRMHFGSTVDVGNDLTLTVTSRNQSGTGSISVLVSADSGDVETVELLEVATGVFRASISTTDVISDNHDGRLSVTFGDVIDATYSEITDNEPVEYHVRTRINHLAETTLPTRLFWLTEGQTVAVQIDRLDVVSDTPSSPLLAAVLSVDNSLIRLQHVPGESEQILITADKTGYYSLYLQTSLNSIVELVTSVRIVEPDVNRDGVVDGTDLDLVCIAVSSGSNQTPFDVNRDQQVDRQDVLALTDLLGVPIGDSNFDGHFNSQDLVAIFIAAEYEDALVGNSSWSTGDWNCDGEFNTADLVLAFQANTYSLAAQNQKSLSTPAGLSTKPDSQVKSNDSVNRSGNMTPFAETTNSRSDVLHASEVKFEDQTKEMTTNSHHPIRLISAAIYGDFLRSEPDRKQVSRRVNANAFVVERSSSEESES